MTNDYSNEADTVGNALDTVFLKKNQGSNNANENVVTDANGDITTEAKPNIPTGSSTATDIKMNGSQSAGLSNNFARADHVHPHDTSKLNANLNSSNSGKFLKVDTDGSVICDTINIDSDYGTFGELQKLINDASDNDVIILNKDYKNSGNENYISINKPLTIIGNGHIIDGDKKNGIITLFAYGSCKFNGIVFVNGDFAIGGAIWLNSSDNIISNCSFINNNSTNGGGLAIASSNNIIHNCEFINNTATNGGAINIAYSSTPNINNTIYNCVFRYNSATDGANIYNSSSAITIYDCHITTGLHNVVNKDSVYIDDVNSSISTHNSSSSAHQDLFSQYARLEDIGSLNNQIVEEMPFYWVDDFLTYASSSYNVFYDPNNDIQYLIDFIDSNDNDSGFTSDDIKTDRLYQIPYGSSYTHDICVAFTYDETNEEYDAHYVTTNERYATLYELSLKASASSIPTIADNLTTNDATQVLSAKQGKVLNDLIGNISTIINGNGS